MDNLKQTPNKGTGEVMPEINFSKVDNLAQITGELSPTDIVASIKGDAYKEKTQLIRKLLGQQNIAKADEIKKTLPGFACSGIFKGRRSKANLKTYSQCIGLDFDDIPVDMIKELVKKARACKYTLMCFISVSDCGIKILVRVNSSVEHHKEAYQQVMEYYEGLLGVSADKATKDVARLCFFSHDKNIYYNDRAAIFTVNLSASVPEINTEGGNGLSHTELSFNEAVKATDNLKTLVPGDRNNYVHLLACNCNRYGIPQEETVKYIQLRIEHGLPESEVNSTIESAYSSNQEQFNTWSLSKYIQPKSNNELTLSSMEACLRKVLSEFFNPLK